MDDNLFNDLVQGLNEAIAHEKGELTLKTTVRSTDDFLSIYYQLPKEKKDILKLMANDMLIATSKV